MNETRKKKNQNNKTLIIRLHRFVSEKKAKLNQSDYIVGDIRIGKSNFIKLEILRLI